MKIILICFSLSFVVSYSQDTIKFFKKIDDLELKYENLKKEADSIRKQSLIEIGKLTQSISELNDTLTAHYTNFDSITRSILKENEDEFANNVKENQKVQENFYEFIKLSGDRYCQLDEKLTSEELSLFLRKIINPQSNELGFTLSTKFEEVMSNRLIELADKILKDNSDKPETKVKITNTIKTVASILDNPIVNDITGAIPFASTIKGMVSTASGIILNLLDKGDIKDVYKESFVNQLSEVQNSILNDLAPIISFYDDMARLDNEYQISLQNIRTNFDLLGNDLEEFFTTPHSLDHEFTFLN